MGSEDSPHVVNESIIRVAPPSAAKRQNGCRGFKQHIPPLKM